MGVGRVAHAVVDRAFLGQQQILGQGLGVQLIDIAGHQHALGIVPGARPDAIAGIDRRLRRRAIGGGDGGGAEIGVPLALGRARRLGQAGAIGVGPGQTAIVGALALADAGDEEGHIRADLALGLHRDDAAADRRCGPQDGKGPQNRTLHEKPPRNE